LSTRSTKTETDARIRRTFRHFTVAAMLAGLTSVGCWEQLDGGNWFPQMKRQIAIQAFENTGIEGHPQGLTPPDGTVPVGSVAVDIASLSEPERNALVNPMKADLTSLKRGEVLYDRYCTTCHGGDGLADGPVAGKPFGQGPFDGIMQIGGPASLAKVFSDGHIYATISLGGARMPSYQRIQPEDRWHLINYLRDLNGQGGR
jgi:mono/diheme cytochrome c family protein